ncbi:MAG: DUF4412 domain-containing protein [Bacteroidota bacterium]
MGFKTFLSIFILLISSLSVSAQDLPSRAEQRARNRAENRANNRVDRSVDNAVDGAIDAVGGIFKRKKKKRNNDEDQAEESAEAAEDTGGFQMPGIMTGGPWEPYTNPVTYSMTMEVTQVNRRGKEENTSMKMAVDTEAFGVHIVDEGEESRMILDTQNGKVTVISNADGEQTAVRMRMPNLTSPEEAEETMEEAIANVTIERTGETRVIDGYNCEKVIYNNTEEGYVTEAWVTDEVELTALDLGGPFMKMYKTKGAANSSLSQPYQEFPLESTTTDKRGNVTNMKIRDLKVGADADHSILDVSGITVQDMGF